MKNLGKTLIHDTLFAEGHVANIIKIILAIVIISIVGYMNLELGYTGWAIGIPSTISMLLVGSAGEYFDRKSGIRYDDMDSKC